MHEKLTQWLRLLLPPDTDTSEHPDMAVIESRLSSVEQEQQEIHLRLQLLERRGDPRGIREGQHDA